MPDPHVVDLGGNRTVTALLYPASEPLAVLVLAHGAGANQHSAFMVGFADALAARRISVLTFNFPYTERGRKLPDPQPVLEHGFRTVLEWTSTQADVAGLPLFIGGKSMGGRMATHIAASQDAGTEGAPDWWRRLRGLVLLGYPLHPPARPQQIRVAHLPRITHPMLFVQGEKDAFGTPAELETFLGVLGAPVVLRPVPMGGHSFEVPKRSGIRQEDVYAGVQDTIAGWMVERLT